jgi:cold shock protein
VTAVCLGQARPARLPRTERLAAKGFGFITPEDGSKDVFVHASALERAGIQLLHEGEKASFALEDTERDAAAFRYRARSLRRSA